MPPNRALALTTLLIATLLPVHADPGDVTHTISAPCRYPVGIASDGASLYVLDWRDARLYRVQPTDGRITHTLDAPSLRPHGLTVGGDRLYVSDDQTGRVFALNPADGRITNTFEAPGSRPTGLAAADDILYLLEAGSRKIYKVLPEDGTILAYFDAPSRSCTCLAFDGRHLWVSDRVADEIYFVDPDTGLVLGILNAPGPHATGLTVHDGHLWVADLQDRRISRVVTHDEKKYYLHEPREARVEYLWGMYNYGPGDVTDLVVHVALPVDLPHQELLTRFHFDTEPDERPTDKWGQPCATFRVDRLPAGTRKELGFQVSARVSAIRYLIDPARVGSLEDIPADVRQAYTADGERYRIHSPFIQDLARQIVGDEKNPYWIARKIYNHLIAKLAYQMVGGWDVPEVVLKRGTGSCSEYTFAFIALCRAAGVPARYQGSVVVRGDDASIDRPHHRWAQVYLPNYGWVPVDANRGDKAAPADQARGFGELSNRFLITTQGGGDSEYLRWGYNGHHTYHATGYCNVQTESLGFWEPTNVSDQPPGAGNPR
jgi:transglutaminase-like putative cysteine protease/sugar lactone lactonase YvrE